MNGEETAIPVGRLDGRENGRNFFCAMGGQEPLFDQSVDVVKLRDFDKDWRDSGWTTSDELQSADRGEEGCTSALIDFPAFSLLEAEGGKKTGEAVELSA